MRLTQLITNLACVLFLFSVLTACSGSATPDQPQQATSTQGLSSPQEVLRSTSATSAQRFANASGFLSGHSQRILSVFGLPGAIMFSSSDTQATKFEGLSYAIYRFTIPNYTDWGRIRYYWQGNGPDWSHTWIGVGNLDDDCWEWNRMGQVGALDLGSFEGYLNVNSEMVVCVLLDGKTSGTLRWLAIGDYVGRVQAVDWDGDVGRGCTMALVGGIPAIVYYGADFQTIKYVRARTVDGLGWYPPQTIPNTGAPGIGLSLVDLQGKPGIAYQESASDELRFVSAKDHDITGWNDPVVLDSLGSTGHEPSALMVNGRPAVAYYEYRGDDSQLKYIRANNADGSDWGAPDLVYGDGDCRSPSMAIIGGNPAISYHAVSESDLAYVRATDADGSSWSTPKVVFTDYASGDCSSLAEVDGRPAVCFYVWDSFRNSGQLRYIFALDNVGDSWITNLAMIIEGADDLDVGRGTSLVVIGGFPVVAYYDSTNYKLKLATGSDKAGLNWNSPVVIDNATRTGEYPSLINLNGFPAVCYYEYEPGANLMYQLVAD
jgi:hypothetical protein